MTDLVVSEPEARSRHRQRQRHHHHHHRRRWRLVLAVAAGLVAVYYGLVIGGMQLRDSTEVALDDSELSSGADRVTVEIEALELDPGSSSFDVRLQPVPHGTFAGGSPGELAAPLELRVASPGKSPVSFDFPSQQIIDPVGTTVDIAGGAQSFPFDHPRMEFRLEALSAGEAVPLDVEMADQTEGWNLGGTISDDDDVLRFELDASREMLPVAFTLFYIAGIVVVALITVALIGGAIVRGRVGFDQVIWLGAMLVAIPAVRNEMPGVPPIGTAVDMFVFLPSVVIVAAALLASIVVLTLHEAAEYRAPGAAHHEDHETHETHEANGTGHAGDPGHPGHPDHPGEGE